MRACSGMRSGPREATMQSRAKTDKTSCSARVSYVSHERERDATARVRQYMARAVREAFRPAYRAAFCVSCIYVPRLPACCLITCRQQLPDFLTTAARAAAYRLP